MIEVTVLIADDHLDCVDEVCASLRAAGLEVRATLRLTGVVTGAAADPAALAAVPGVAAVEPVRRDIGVPPPGSPLQ